MNAQAEGNELSLVHGFNVIALYTTTLADFIYLFIYLFIIIIIIFILATCEPVFDFEAAVYIKKLASLLAHKWKKSYSVIACYIRARMQVAILRSVSLCIRGTRLKWRSAVIDDGAGIPRLQED